MNREKIDFDLYLIADTEQVQKDLISSVKMAIDGGVKVVQLRGKRMPARELLKIGKRLRLLTNSSSVKLFINDRIDIAMAVDADGIHLGQNSIPVSVARDIAGDKFIVGVSTHNIKEAKEAELGGADFITFGPIFATRSKLVYGPPVGLRRLANIAKDVKIPVFAIGGIKTDRINSVMEKGAYGIAVISGILKSGSVYTAAVNMIEKLRYHHKEVRGD